MAPAPNRQRMPALPSSRRSVAAKIELLVDTSKYRHFGAGNRRICSYCAAASRTTHPTASDRSDGSHVTSGVRASGTRRPV